MNIVAKTSTVHTGAYKNRPILYLVIHYTAGTNSRKGVARNVAAMFANPNNRAASADYIVDDGEIVQYNGDIPNRYTYAVGGAKYSINYTPLAGTFYGTCKNYNSISIEMCSTKSNTKSLSASDTDWSVSASVVDKTVELARYLMKKYNIPSDRVIMHHHVTGKLCPQPWCLNTRRLAGWEAFKARLTEEEVNMTEKEVRKLITDEVAEQLGMIQEPVYNTIEDIPKDWGRDTVQKLVNRGALKGTENGLGLTKTMLRVLVIMDRLGNL